MHAPVIIVTGVIRGIGRAILDRGCPAKGLTAGGLARRLICDYLRQTRTMLLIENSSVVRSLGEAWKASERSE